MFYILYITHEQNLKMLLKMVQPLFQWTIYLHIDTEWSGPLFQWAMQEVSISPLFKTEKNVHM